MGCMAFHFGGHVKLLFPSRTDPEGFIAGLDHAFVAAYGSGYPDHQRALLDAAHLMLSEIGRTNTPYHNVEHTMMVSIAGIHVAAGRVILAGPIPPEIWLSFFVSLLLHDIGYVRGIFPQDSAEVIVADGTGRMVRLPTSTSDAVLTPYHVDRSLGFLSRHFANSTTVDCNLVNACIENTRFPVPDRTKPVTDSWPDLVRGTDLVGQLADPNYLHKIPLLFREFQESDPTRATAYESAEQMIALYPNFFWKDAFPFMTSAVKCLGQTASGRIWISSLYSQVFQIEHAQHLASAVQAPV